MTLDLGDLSTAHLLFQDSQQFQLFKMSVSCVLSNLIWCTDSLLEAHDIPICADGREPSIGKSHSVLWISQLWRGLYLRTCLHTSTDQPSTSTANRPNWSWHFWGLQKGTPNYFVVCPTRKVSLMRKINFLKVPLKWLNSARLLTPFDINTLIFFFF